MSTFQLYCFVLRVKRDLISVFKVSDHVHAMRVLNNAYALERK